MRGGKPDTSVTACTRHSHAWGQGSACTMGLGTCGTALDRPTAPAVPKEAPQEEMALSQCQPSLPSPLGLLPRSSHPRLLPGLCHPCESASPDPSNPQLWIPGHHSPSSLQSPSCQGQALSPSPASLLCQPRGAGWEGMSTVPKPFTFAMRRRKRTKNPSNHAQPWAWHTTLIWDGPQLPAADYVGRREFTGG